jgi:phosphopantetheine--protein transferase-like protein
VIGVGIDAVDVERFATVLARRPSMAERLFTDGERADASGSVPRLGARFAAKEAVMKALGVGLGAFKLRDVEVVRLASGAPTLRLHGAAAALADACGVRRWHVSLTHTALTAQAVVLAE